MRRSELCACKKACLRAPWPDCDGLCRECWEAWCTGQDGHEPIGATYLDVYGVGNVWTGWIMSQAPDAVAKTPGELQTVERAPRCPKCDYPMVRRVGCWKCYRLAHEETVVVPEDLELPRAPRCRPIVRELLEG